MQYHALFVIFGKAVKFEIAICCKLSVASNSSYQTA